MPDIIIHFDEKEIIDNIKTFTPGVQEKLSIHINKINNNKLSYFEEDSRYILKFEGKYKEIAAAEHVTMLMANAFNIETCENGLIKKDGKICYITKRFDRVKENKIHVEDFCQLSNKLTEDKYKGSYEYIGKMIDRFSDIPQFDKNKLFRIVLFSYISLNSDMHLKNFSLIEDKKIELNGSGGNYEIEIEM